MFPKIIVQRPEQLPWSTGGVPVNAVIGGYVFEGSGRPLRKLPERERRTVNQPVERKHKGW